MPKYTYIIFLISISISTTIFNIDKNQSIVKWKGSKSTGSSHDGLILIENGFININDNIIIGGEININMNSITCTDIEDSKSNQYLIEHLKNDDFFSVSTFPIASLNIHSITPVSQNHDLVDNSSLLKGEYLFLCDLTIKDSTHAIDFIADIKINKNAAIATGSIEIDRSQFGIKYKSKSWYPDLGDRFINDIFELYFNLVAFPKS
tara:strand:- start:505 stop:1122 length:618 start_codon:yes stop_codon:yes gene_type:complete